MKRDTWVLLIVLAALAAIAWWIWKKPKGVTSVGPVTSSTVLSPTVTPINVVTPDNAPLPDDLSGVIRAPTSAISTVTYAGGKGGLGVGGGGLLL